MMFCNMHCIVWSYNLSNGSKSTYTGINAQNLNGLSEKVTGPVSLWVSVVKALNSSIVDLFCTHAAVTHSSWQFLMLSRASRMTMSQCWTNAKSSLLTWKEQIVAASCSMHTECALASAIPCRLLISYMMFIPWKKNKGGVMVNTCKEFQLRPLSKGDPSIRDFAPA